MRAVVMQDSELRVADVPDPVPGPGEVLVEVLACGICGSDLHCASHGPEFNAATSAAAGSELMDLDRPVVFGARVRRPRRGLRARRRTANSVGPESGIDALLLREQPVMLGFAGPEAPGGYGELMVLSEPLLIEVPDHVPTEVAALTEPLAVAYRTVARAEVGANDVPLVVGCGPIGLAVIAVLKMKGCRSDRRVGLLARTARIGKATRCGRGRRPERGSPFEALAAAAATADPAKLAPPVPVLGQMPLRPTVAFECVGVPGLIQQLIAGVPPGRGSPLPAST